MPVGAQKTCFVVMGFGEKTDYKTSRVLDLNKTYRQIIKKAVEAAGLICIRADEIAHSGTIDAPMYEQLLDADLVIADLSTSNMNAAYELGIRHALKPATTIIIAETQFDAPFDVNHITIRKYRHDGKALDIDEAESFRDKLRQAIEDVMANGRVDSPVYTFLPLEAPIRRAAMQAAADATQSAKNPHSDPPAPGADAQSLANLMEMARDCKAESDWAGARTMLKKARKIAPHDVYVVQQFALATYKGEQPDTVTALNEARDILIPLNPLASNDAETLGLWGAVHKRIFEATGKSSALDAAIQAHEKGFWLLNDYYNGINLAFLLDTRAAQQTKREEAITDALLARRRRRAVLAICDARLKDIKDSPETRDDRYWIVATQAEAAFGSGNAQRGAEMLEAAAGLAGADWMLKSTQDQLGKLRKLQDPSPLSVLQLD